MLEVKDLRIHFHSAPEGHDAVKGISFSVGDGEIIGMVGESGSGEDRNCHGSQRPSSSRRC